MNTREIIRRRLATQRLVGAPFAAPEDVVGWLGAVQSQDYGPAKWSIARRTNDADDAALDKAFSEGLILRTHILRPTWHFVLPEDIRWMLELTGPRIHRMMGSANRQLGLDDATLKKGRTVIAKALRRGEHLTRPELTAVLGRAGFGDDGRRLGHIIMETEIAAVICSGVLRGKQHTYALLDERAPNAKRLMRDEALAELTLRYFRSHGPATAKDFAWWSGLTLADVKRGLETVSSDLESAVLDGMTFWFGPGAAPRRTGLPRVHLLQVYDEYVIGYRESRSLVNLSGDATPILPTAGDRVSGLVFVDGELAGRYRRTPRKTDLLIEVALGRPLNATQERALHSAATQLGGFLGTTVTIGRTRGRAHPRPS